MAMKINHSCFFNAKKKGETSMSEELQSMVQIIALYGRGLEALGLKGSMMGGWFAATAIGNYLVSIPMMLWGAIPVWCLWGILIVICLISAIFIFSIMKKLEAATSDEPAPVAELENVENDAI